MKKLIVAAAMALSASSALALANAHNLTIATANHGAGTNGTCQYCHAAHLWNAGTMPAGVAPLWNRNDVTVANVYTSTTIADQTVVPGPNTRTCLSCHDNVTPLGALNNGAISGDLSGTIGAAIVGLDLRNDHPVGVNYVAGTYYDTTTNITVAGLKLYNSQVECASCHEPHNVATKLLRLPVASLCGTCHLK